jgi:hypothetical protein
MPILKTTLHCLVSDMTFRTHSLYLCLKAAIHPHHYYLASHMTTCSEIIQMQLSHRQSDATHQHPQFRDSMQRQNKLDHPACPAPKGCLTQQFTGHLKVIPNVYCHVLSNLVHRTNNLICHLMPVPFSLQHFPLPFHHHLCDSVQDIQFALAITTFFVHKLS